MDKIQTEHKLNLSQKKRKALELIQKHKYTYKHAGQEVGLHEVTVSKYVHDIVNTYKQLTPEKRISFWEHQSISNQYLASIIRDALILEMQNSPKSISTSEKRAIFYSASLAGGLAEDKAAATRSAQAGMTGGINLAQIVCVVHQSLFPSSSPRSLPMPVDVIEAEGVIESQPQDMVSEGVIEGDNELQPIVKVRGVDEVLSPERYAARQIMPDRRPK